MRRLAFSKRCAKEIYRDPINLIFGVGFPIILLLLLSSMQANIPVELFKIESLTPGMTVFGLSFITLFSATLISKDRESAFLQRLYSSPLKTTDFIFGYMLPLFVMSLLQTLCCYLFAVLLGLKLSVNFIYAIIGIIPVAVFNISLGILFGSILGVKQVSGICGALLTNLTAWLSGVWFDLSLLGKGFERVAHLLPFVHAVKLEKALFFGDYKTAVAHLIPVLTYSILITVAAVFCFIKKLKKL